jgi:hypothetical protein
MSKNGLPYDMFLPYLEQRELDEIKEKFQNINGHGMVEFREDSNVVWANREIERK